MNKKLKTGTIGIATHVLGTPFINNTLHTLISNILYTTTHTLLSNIVKQIKGKVDEELIDLIGNETKINKDAIYDRVLYSPKYDKYIVLRRTPNKIGFTITN